MECLLSLCNANIVGVMACFTRLLHFHMLNCQITLFTALDITPRTLERASYVCHRKPSLGILRTLMLVMLRSWYAFLEAQQVPLLHSRHVCLVVQLHNYHIHIPEKHSTPRLCSSQSLLFWVIRAGLHHNDLFMLSLYLF